MDKDEVIATLNDLIETSRDGEAGFRTCADSVKNAQLNQMFEQAAGRYTVHRRTPVPRRQIASRSRTSAAQRGLLIRPPFPASRGGGASLR